MKRQYFYALDKTHLPWRAIDDDRSARGAEPNFDTFLDDVKEKDGRNSFTEVLALSAIARMHPKSPFLKTRDPQVTRNQTEPPDGWKPRLLHAYDKATVI